MKTDRTASPRLHKTIFSYIWKVVVSGDVLEVYKYELLTTNQYLKQMELVLEIFNDLSEHLAHQ